MGFSERLPVFGMRSPGTCLETKGFSAQSQVSGRSQDVLDSGECFGLAFTQACVFTKEATNQKHSMSTRSTRMAVGAVELVDWFANLYLVDLP